jgi:acetyl esterase/lipase
MRTVLQLLLTIALLYIISGAAEGQSPVNKEKYPAGAGLVSLKGRALLKGNPLEADGNVHKFNSPLLRLVRTKSKSPVGTILLLPGGGYEILKMNNEGLKAARFLNNEKFDVAILDYHVSKDLQSRDLALVDALSAYRLLKANRKALGLRGERFVIMGFSTGGQLAARTVGLLKVDDQPDDVILISPSGLNETVPGTVIPAVMPPIHPSANLLCTFSANDNKEWIYRCEEYSKIWNGYDGKASFHLLPDSTYITDKDTGSD